MWDEVSHWIDAHSEIANVDILEGIENVDGLGDVSPIGAEVHLEFDGAGNRAS